jgi:hypothetical protein
MISCKWEAFFTQDLLLLIANKESLGVKRYFRSFDYSERGSVIQSMR